MAKITNHKYSISEAFQQCFYIVPDYQREYVWSEKEVLQLLEDISEQVGGSAEYFIGTVLVSPGESTNHYEIIDGQQRLTTFFLLLCALKQRFQGGQELAVINNLIAMNYTASDGSTQTDLKLEPRYENAEQVMTKIVALNADPETTRNGIVSSGIKSFGSLENLLGAYATIHGFLDDNYQKAPDLRAFWGYLANNVVFIQISTDVSSALKIFETINERGIGLNPMDLLKNLLFTQVKPDKFSKLKDEWKEVTKPLEKQREKPLRFLRYFLMANYKIKQERANSGDSAILREDEIYDWLVEKDNAALCGYKTHPFDFVKQIKRNAELYLDFNQGMGNDGLPSVAMANLKLLTGGAFSLHFVLLLAAANLPKSLFEHFVSQVEVFLFYHIFTKTPSKELERAFSMWADELREVASLPAGSAAQIQALNDWVDKRFQASIIAKAPELSDALNRFTLSSMQRYRTHYLLARLTSWVEEAFKGVKISSSLAIYKGVELEHILPNTPTPATQTDFATSSPGKDYDIYKNKLGNFTLLEKPINIVASNNIYAQKKAEYQKSSYYLTRSIVELAQVGGNSSISRVNAYLKEFPDWTAQSIDERQKLLIELVKEIWKITRLP